MTSIEAGRGIDGNLSFEMQKDTEINRRRNTNGRDARNPGLRNNRN
jgi:hypothetical protein